MAFGWDSSNLNAHCICSMNVGVSPFWKFSMSLGNVSFEHDRTFGKSFLRQDFLFFLFSGQIWIGAGSGKHAVRNILDFAKKCTVGSSGQTYHSDSSWPFVGPPSQMAWQQTMINCSRALRSRGTLRVEGCSERQRFVTSGESAVDITRLLRIDFNRLVLRLS